MNDPATGKPAVTLNSATLAVTTDNKYYQGKKPTGITANSNRLAKELNSPNAF